MGSCVSISKQYDQGLSKSYFEYHFCEVEDLEFRLKNALHMSDQNLQNDGIIEMQRQLTSKDILTFRGFDKHSKNLNPSNFKHDYRTLRDIPEMRSQKSPHLSHNQRLPPTHANTMKIPNCELRLVETMPTVLAKKGIASNLMSTYE